MLLHSSSHSAELIDTPENMKNIQWSRRLLLIFNLLFIYRYSVPYEEKDKTEIVMSSLVLRNEHKAEKVVPNILIIIWKDLILKWKNSLIILFIKCENLLNKSEIGYLFTKL